MKRTVFAGLLILAFSFLAGSSSADEYHYRNLLIGDRASGMAGAYTAVSDDATGLYYNPAGIVYSSGRNLSASVNAYFNQSKTYDSVIAGNGWKRRSSAILPNYFGIVQPMGRYKFGFSYAVPDSVFEDQDQVFENLPLTGGTPPAAIKRYVINFNNQDNTYNFGPSLAMSFSDSLSAGVTLYFFEKKRQWTLNQLITLDEVNARYQWSNVYYERNESGIRPVLGVMWSPRERLSLGLTLSGVFIYESDTSRQSTFWDFDYTSPNQLERTDGSTNEKRKYPIQLNVGAAYFVSNELLITGDLNYFSKVDNKEYDGTESVMVLNGSVGLEYYLSREWALRGGFFTDMANTPEITAGTLSAEEKIDLYGMSMSVSHFTRNTSVSLTGSYAAGSGDAQITSDVNDVQTAEQQSWMLFLSSSYSY